MKNFATSASMLLASLILSATNVQAETPEPLDQLEPEKGEWQLEYYGQFGSTVAAERLHVVEGYYGISDAIAVGVELEGEVSGGDFEFEGVGLNLLYRFDQAEDGKIATGLLLSSGVSTHGKLSEAEARFIVDATGESWSANANVMLRHVNEGGDKGEMLAYGWNLSRTVSKNLRLGVEGSGQAARLGGFSGGMEKAHFVGPAVILELEPAENKELELGFGWFRRLGNDGPRNTGRLFVQVGF
jgi:hypothetical protein